MVNSEALQMIRETVHHEYYSYDTNCATVSLICLCRLMDLELPADVRAAAIGMHGGGGYRGQCGLVEGPLMFIGLYGSHLGKDREEIIAFCRHFSECFDKEYGSLRCRELRPGGFRPDDPPHMCEGLTVRTISFAYEMISGWQK